MLYSTLPFIFDKNLNEGMGVVNIIYIGQKS
jgi:hypothetical protein